MTTSTPYTEAARKAHGCATRGFTLTEVLIASALALVVLAGVISMFLFIGRSGFAASSYSELEGEARRGLLVFAEDVRVASGIRWYSPQLITLLVPKPTLGAVPITYGYDSDRHSPTYRCFFRQEGEPDSEAPRVPLVRQIADDFAFKRYKLEQPGVRDNIAEDDKETKQLQISFRALRSSSSTVTASHSLVSARYVLRNKRVSE